MTPVSADDAAAADQGDVIVVTGSLFSRADIETASPVTSLSSETLQERGINTVAEAVQRIPSNNAGTIQQGWNTGFNFASGANAPALRGLTVQSTLSIVDGLRVAPYPLADDGQRNFVDLNTIPSGIIDRIEVLRDGASSTYGADAIAGVINVITKKQIQGLHINASAGVSQQGDAGEYRADAQWGYGDLNEQGFNFYVAGEWQKQNALWARDRGYPFNTQDWSNICNDAGTTCMDSLNWNAYTQEDGFFNGLISVPGVTLVRPVDDAPLDPNNPDDLPPNPNTGAGRFTFLNPAAGCRGFEQHVLPAGTAGGGTAPLAGVCEVNQQSQFIMLQPEIERRGLSGRLTVNAGDRAQVYAEVNYYNTITNASFTPLGFNGTPVPPTTAGLGAYNVMLPVYVCGAGVGTRAGTNTGCNATNGVLNPYNPFAAQGRTAQAFVRSTRGRSVETNSRALRATIGVDGSFGDNWTYTANFTASEMKLRRDEGNYFIPQRIMNAAAQGLINFNDLEAMPQSVWDYIAPLESTVSTSQLWQGQATLAKELFELPGGPLQAAVGLSYREESIDAPSANPAADISDQYDRYYSINAVGTAGSRNVKSAFYEISAPVLDSLELSASGRYDKYSTGQENFSPKFGAKFTPVDFLTVRGTWSEGFRIPSFNEAFGLPTTGYITARVDCGTPAAPGTAAAYCATHANNGYVNGQYNLGLTTVGNPALDPEKSTAYTAGIILEPMRNVSLTVDYWHIKVDGLIGSPGGQSDAIDQYYTNNGVVTQPGFTAIPGAPDPAFPNALPVLGFLQTQFVNQSSETVSGIDFGFNAKFPITDAITLRSVFDASWLMKYQVTRDNGDVENYEGTLAPCNITSCSGAPEWRASWQNSVDIGDSTFSLTAYYTEGYKTEAVDEGGHAGDCAYNARHFTATAAYANGDPVNCTQGAAWNVDFNARHTFADRYTIYLDVLNIFGIDADFDPSAAYGLFGFNPSWQGPNMLGRFFRVGAKVDF